MQITFPIKRRLHRKELTLKGRAEVVETRPMPFGKVQYKVKNIEIIKGDYWVTKKR